MVSMKEARKGYAGRTTVSGKQVNEAGEVTKPRVRKRATRRASFRAWARDAYKGTTNLSPKLARIVRGA